MRWTSKFSVITASSMIVAAKEASQSIEPDREPREATIPLEATESKPLGRPRKQQKPCGQSHHENKEPRRRRDDSHSNGEGNGETRKVQQGRARQGNGRGKHGSDRESTKGGIRRSRSPKRQHSCAVAMSF